MIEWSQTDDPDFESNCIFIDELAFHINMKRSMGWAPKGERAVTKTPLARAQTTTILGAISPFGVVSVKVKRPYEASSNKRKLPSTSNAIKNTGTTTGHYFNFIGYHEQARVVQELLSCNGRENGFSNRRLLVQGYRRIHVTAFNTAI